MKDPLETDWDDRKPERVLPDLYEFRVAGLIGPVIRAALPELSTDTANRQSTLTGIAAGPGVLDDLLRCLAGHGLVATHILISRENRWHHGSAARHPGAEQSPSG